MARYKEAIEWMAYNDDTDFMDDEDSSMSVTASMVADLWGKTHDQLRKDLRKELDSMERNKSCMPSA